MIDERRLRWMCRRGMKELDLLLLAYLERRYAAASAAERAAFEQLLSLQDPEILHCIGDWREGGSEPLDRVIADLTAFGT